MTAPITDREVKWATPLPTLDPGPLSIEPYVSPEFYKKEKRQIFKKAWLEVARVEEIPEKGDFLVSKMEAWDSEIILVRGKDDKIRGFHNICPHRGMKVSRCQDSGGPFGHADVYQKGNGHVFVCPFHGWTYDLDGSLRPIVGEEYLAKDFKRSENGLPEISVDTWNGFIFVHYQQNPPQTLREFIDPLARDLDDFPFDDFNHIARYSARCKSNWKAFIDAFHEAYHAVFLHGRSIPDCGATPEYGVPNSARVYGPHHSVSMWANPDHQPTPAETIAWKYGVSFTPGENNQLGGLNPSNDENWWFDINVFFPNFFVDVGPGWYFTYNFRPVSENETVWIMNIYQADAKTPSEKIAQEHTKVILRDIVYEDLSTLEDTQEMLESGVLTHLNATFDPEVAVRHQHATVMEWVNSGENS